jgi:S-formylglutathione hydrolase FrmB
MALLRLDHTPQSTQLCIPLYAILPDPGDIKDVPVRKRKVLYLLHGLSEDGSAWQRHTMIEMIARQYGLVVVMPSVGRSFYADQRDGQHYFTYLTEELPAYLESVFGLAPVRENTLIAGSSMGGYGALKTVLNFPERFAAAASFSGVTSLEFLRLYPDDPRNAKFAFLFGDLEKLHGGPHDPMTWLQQAAQHKTNLPDLYIACGKQEDLFPLNEIFHAACSELGIPHHYVTEDGQHNWDFWNKHLRKFLAFALGEPPLE